MGRGEGVYLVMDGYRMDRGLGDFEFWICVVIYGFMSGGSCGWVSGKY